MHTHVTGHGLARIYIHRGPWARACDGRYACIHTRRTMGSRLYTHRGTWGRAGDESYTHTHACATMYTHRGPRSVTHTATRAGPWALAYIHARLDMGPRATLVWNTKCMCSNYRGRSTVVHARSVYIQHLWNDTCAWTPSCFKLV